MHTSKHICTGWPSNGLEHMFQRCQGLIRWLLLLINTILGTMRQHGDGIIGECLVSPTHSPKPHHNRNLTTPPPPSLHHGYQQEQICNQRVKCESPEMRPPFAIFTVNSLKQATLPTRTLWWWFCVWWSSSMLDTVTLEEKIDWGHLSNFPLVPVQMMRDPVQMMQWFKIEQSPLPPPSQTSRQAIESAHH